MGKACRELAAGASQQPEPLNPPMRACEEQDVYAALRHLRGFIVYYKPIRVATRKHSSSSLCGDEGLFIFSKNIRRKNND